MKALTGEKPRRIFVKDAALPKDLCVRIQNGLEDILPSRFYLVIFQTDCPAVEHHQSCTQQCSTNDIATAMDTGHQPSNDHKQGKGYDYRSDCAPEGFVFDPAVKLHDSRGHHAHDQHGGGRGIRRSQIAVDQNRSVIDHNRIKEDISRHHQDIKSAQHQNAVVHF